MKNNEQCFKGFFGEARPIRRRPRSLEHNLQSRCVRWFRLQYPNIRHNLFAVPNGGYRTKTTAAKIRAEGALPGVADLILLIARGEYHGLLIEMKTDKGRQSEAQREWQELITKDGYKYVVVRSIEEFIKVVTDYLNETE